MRKKYGTQLFLLTMVLALCAGAYLGLRWWNAGAEDRAAAQADYLARLEDLSALSFQRGETSLSFTRDGEGTWTYDGDSDFPVDQSRLTQLEETLSALAAIRVIDDPEADSSYGLDAPELTLTATDGGGETVTLLVGSQVDGNYYARLEGDALIYTISSSLMDQTEGALLDFIALEDIPWVTEEQVQSVVLTIDGVESTYTKEAVTQETTDEETGETAETTTYVWSRDGEALNGEDTVLQDGVDALSLLAFRSCAAWKPDEAALAALGLDDPDRITVTYDDGSYTLLLGDTDESGNYYGQLEGSYQVGILSPGYVEDLLALPTAQTQAEADAQAAAEAEAEADGETSAPSETAAPAETSAGEDGTA